MMKTVWIFRSIFFVSVFFFSFLQYTFAAEAGEGDAVPNAGSQNGSLTEQIVGATQQTFESCPRGERPCGPVCMSKTFSCCNKATGTICPPGKSCCGLKCGCGPCQTCSENTCIPNPKCTEEIMSQSGSAGTSSTTAGTTATSTTATTTGFASLAVPAAAVPVAAAAIVGVLGAAADTGSSDSRRPISP